MKALGFHSSVRIRLKNIGKIKVNEKGRKNVVGMKTRATIIKNRLGPPHKDVEYDIYFDSGIDDAGAWLNILQDLKLAKAGSWWTIDLPKEDRFKELVDPETAEVKELDTYSRKKAYKFSFRSKDFESWLEANPKLKEHLYRVICDEYIMTYKLNEDFGVGDIEIEEDEENND